MKLDYKVTIGIEIHTQLLTKTKAFCGCSTNFGDSPNSNICPVCLGMPGSLPVVNKKLIDYAIILGHSLHCKISGDIIFDRKNYFYPDLSKGYQISQSGNPICRGGYVQLDNGSKINLERVHMEEDTAKSMHSAGFVPQNCTYLDFNRAGIPLLEIVSNPEIRSAQEAYEYLNKLKQILIYTKISDGNMAQGSLRCDVNISVSKTDILGTKVEIKNINSFKNAQKVIEIESAIQIKALEGGEKILQATKTLNPTTMELKTMRIKEDSDDYRYFEEPDIPPIYVPKKIIEDLKKCLVELPEDKKNRFVRKYKITMQDARVLTKSNVLADYFEKASEQANAKIVSNLIQSELLAYLNKHEIALEGCQITPEMIGQLSNFLDSGKISSKIAKKVFQSMSKSYKMPKQIIKEQGLVQISDNSIIQKMIKEILIENPIQLKEYRAGKVRLFGFFVGQLMKKSSGKVNPKIAKNLLVEMLNFSK